MKNKCTTCELLQRSDHLQLKLAYTNLASDIQAERCVCSTKFHTNYIGVLLNVILTLLAMAKSESCCCTDSSQNFAGSTQRELDGFEFDHVHHVTWSGAQTDQKEDKVCLRLIRLRDVRRPNGNPKSEKTQSRQQPTANRQATATANNRYHTQAE